MEDESANEALRFDKSFKDSSKGPSQDTEESSNEVLWRIGELEADVEVSGAAATDDARRRCPKSSSCRYVRLIDQHGAAAAWHNVSTSVKVWQVILEAAIRYR